MKTVICGEFNQETNRYAKGVTGEAEYRSRWYEWNDSAIRKAFAGTASELGGFYDVLDREDDCKLISVMSVCASPGPVTAQEIWQQVTDRLVDTVDRLEQVDGVLLALHGAMVTEEMEDPEGELLEILRQKLGPTVPIVTTLDLHANMTEKMMANATAFFPYDYYPHTDAYEVGARAAQCLWDTMNCKIQPVMKWNKLDLIFPYVPTALPAFVPLLQEAQQLRQAGTLINAGICHGFFASDIYDQGAAVLTVSDNNPELAQTLADELAAKIWAARKQLDRQFYDADEAVKLAMAATEYPVVLADVADNPGSGASADSVVLLQKLVEAGAQDVAVSMIYDPQVAEQAWQAGVGAEISVTLGGKIAPEITGGSYGCNAIVEALTDGKYRNQDAMNRGVWIRLGPTALLRIGGVRVIVCSVRSQTYDLEVYRHCGIQPENMKILVVKSAAHFRASFGTVAKKIYDVETPALGPMRPQALPLAHSRRPIYPLDDV